MSILVDDTGVHITDNKIKQVNNKILFRQWQSSKGSIQGDWIKVYELVWGKKRNELFDLVWLGNISSPSWIKSRWILKLINFKSLKLKITWNYIIWKNIP